MGQEMFDLGSQPPPRSLLISAVKSKHQTGHVLRLSLVVHEFMNWGTAVCSLKILLQFFSVNLLIRRSPSYDLYIQTLLSILLIRIHLLEPIQKGGERHQRAELK